MSIPGYMTITGENQGAIAGSSFKQGQEDTIEVLSFDHLIDCRHVRKPRLPPVIRCTVRLC